MTIDLLRSFDMAPQLESIAGLSGMKVFRFVRLTRILKTMQFARVLRMVMALRRGRRADVRKDEKG